MTTLNSPCPNRAHSPRIVAGKGWTCPDCDAGTEPSPLAAALAARDEGMARASAAHPDERARVEAAIRRLAATGRPFSANDIRAMHGAKGAVVGATFTAMEKARVIRPLPQAERSTSKATHGHRINLWIGAAA